MTTTEPTTEEALWLYIGDLPECGHRRQYAADWYEERSVMVECHHCGGGRPGQWMFAVGDDGKCDTCKGEQYIPDRNGRMAAALRATAGRVPYQDAADGDYSWFAEVPDDDEVVIHPQSDVPDEVFNHLHSGDYHNNHDGTEWHQYPTAAAAIRDLCEAWCKVNYGEVGE